MKWEDTVNFRHTVITTKTAQKRYYDSYLNHESLVKLPKQYSYTFNMGRDLQDFYSEYKKDSSLSVSDFVCEFSKYH